MEQIVLH